jgi:hypothetical protein
MYTGETLKFQEHHDDVHLDLIEFLGYVQLYPEHREIVDLMEVSGITTTICLVPNVRTPTPSLFFFSAAIPISLASSAHLNKSPTCRGQHSEPYHSSQLIYSFFFMLCIQHNNQTNKLENKLSNKLENKE